MAGRRWRTSHLLSGVTLVAVVASVGVVALGVAEAGAASQSFTASGSGFEYQVPAGVTSIDVTVFGANGGHIGVASGGTGGRISATLPVTACEVLVVDVGGIGATGGTAADGAGGVHGGGSGGTSTGLIIGQGAGGGGESDVVRNGTPLLVAGGGGGGRRWWPRRPGGSSWW